MTALSTDAANQPAPRTDAAQWLSERRRKYQPLLDKADECAKLTETAKWQSNYAEWTKRHKDTYEFQCSIIAEEIDNIRKHGSNEEAEKQIRDAAKSISTERAAHEAWLARSVEPVSKIAQKCKDFVDSVLTEAEKEERQTPLVSRGFAKEIEDSVATWASVKWDEQTGTVTIH